MKVKVIDELPYYDPHCSHGNEYDYYLNLVTYTVYFKHMASSVKR